ncbi:MAG: T9SS type A sorting domain-containing protein, partial [Dysgonamonadaceae bacterium]|jgi:hypothetical protein|nr:T9SS type A sorting domain-containing protein [Dysgonamonadaceae bacterium]
MWQGIVILDLPLSQNPGTVELKNGAIIEHALCAISTASANYGKSIGGIIKASDATFRNNLQAIEYYPYTATLPAFKDFTKCTFTIDSANRFAANGEIFKYHVTLWGVQGVVFEGCLFENAFNTSGGGIGIYAMDAGFKITNYCKQGGMPPGIDCACYQTHTTPTSFKNFITGIRSESTGNPSSIHIDQSEFQYLNTGVNLNTQSNYRITRCNFIDIGGIGLNSSNSSGYQIEENSFSATSSPFAATGILMNNSGTANNRIYKNYFSNLDKGISVQSTNGQPYSVFSIPQGLQFVCNNFIGNKYDIYLLSDAIISHGQGSLSSGANNKFVGTKLSSIYSLNSRPIYYYHSLGSNQAPFHCTNNITVNGNATPNLCASTFCLPGIKIRSTDSLEQYKMMQQQYDQLLTQLEENPELLQEILVLSDAMRELSDHAISRILGDSILYLDALKSWYEVVRTPIAKYSLAETYFYEKKFEQSEAVLKGIPKLFAFNESEQKEHDNYMQFYNFKKQMQLSEKNWTQLDEKEISHLQTIAETTRGRSSGMAKGVLCFFYNICYEDEIEEGGEGIHPPKNAAVESQTADIQEQNQTYELFLYPNPTESEMTVTINNPAVKIVQIEIYDITGRKVYQQSVDQLYGTLHLNKLAQGIYILKVRLNQGDMVVRKVVKR